MKRFLLIALCSWLLSFTGCAMHRGANCNSGHCQSSHCKGGSSHRPGGGILGGLAGRGGCKSCQGGVPVGCRPGPLRWQQGGLDYGNTLATGLMQHPGQVVQSMPVNPGPPSGTVAYPYYTTRGPRDFLLDNPPSIGR